MPRREKYAPSHRNIEADRPQPSPQKKSLRKTSVLVGVAVAATGLAVSGGVLAKDAAPADPAASVIAAAEADRKGAPISAQLVRDRENDTSRSADRGALDETKQAALDQQSGGQVTRTADLTSADPRDIARSMLPEFGFAESEFGCLDALYVSESDWDMHADNPTSSAYGIPQALTGGTHELPDDYMSNPVSQINWGLGYIKDSYGTPCSAWEFKQSNNWY